jgi:hypothetical protein
MSLDIILAQSGSISNTSGTTSTGSHLREVFWPYRNLSGALNAQHSPDDQESSDVPSSSNCASTSSAILWRARGAITPTGYLRRWMLPARQKRSPVKSFTLSTSSVEVHYCVRNICLHGPVRHPPTTSKCSHLSIWIRSAAGISALSSLDWQGDGPKGIYQKG